MQVKNPYLRIYLPTSLDFFPRPRFNSTTQPFKRQTLVRHMENRMAPTNSFSIKYCCRSSRRFKYIVAQCFSFAPTITAQKTSSGSSWSYLEQVQTFACLQQRVFTTRQPFQSLATRVPAELSDTLPGDGFVISCPIWDHPEFGRLCEGLFFRS